MPYPAPPPRTPEEIAVRAWVLAVLGAELSQVAYADQKSPRPSKPYATILKLAEVALGEDVDRYLLAGDPAEQILRIDSQRQGSFRVVIYGPDHTTLSRRLELSMSDRAVVEANCAAGITVAQTLGGIARRSRLTDGVTEDRSVVDYQVRYRVWVDRPESDSITALEADIEEA